MDSFSDPSSIFSANQEQSSLIHSSGDFSFGTQNIASLLLCYRVAWFLPVRCGWTTKHRWHQDGRLMSSQAKLLVWVNLIGIELTKLGSFVVHRLIKLKLVEYWSTYLPYLRPVWSDIEKNWCNYNMQIFYCQKTCLFDKKKRNICLSNSN